ncbi:cellulose biosynthesis cyclic di-GMP-binding regulatory protein BcsB [Methylobacterium sp. BTF04]|uniref:cellulose biosynthesis cyclic di-GMP-binding regulatory protein BcsB n=1 Tax=Methylobacterium sp. BTF04 TaxID=2708300 RepID=UPI001FEDC207|nr:cellulose biosynthesis cyclic di-GMP-binding regulatory protein BcsB [Methylobacterium sp. BTF04]
MRVATITLRLVALGVLAQAPSAGAQSFVGAGGPTERLTVPPSGNALRRAAAPESGPRAAIPADPLRQPVLTTSAPARRLPATTGGFRLEGEEDALRFPVYVTEAQSRGRPRLRVSYLSAISVAPEASELVASVNGIVVGRTRIQAPGAVKVVEFELPEGSLKLGYNAIDLSASQRHRVDCSLDATYELWTQIDPSRSGLVVPPVAAGGIELKDLAALEPDDSGALPVRVVVNDKPSLPRLERIFHAVEAIGLVGRIARPIVEFGPLMPGRAGINLLVGTASELRGSPDLESIGPVTGPKLAMLPPREDRAPTLVVSGTSYDEVEAAIAILARGTEPYGTSRGLKAAALLRGVAVTSGDRVPLQSLGVSTREFSGRLLRTSFDVHLPADFLPADYGKVMLNLAGAYASGLAPEARILVDLNGRNAASVPLPQTRGEVFENNTIPLPLSLWRPGLNRVDIAAQVPVPADATCGLGGPDLKRERFLFLDRTSLSIPNLARTAKVPDLAATTSGAVPFVEGRRRPRIVLPTLDRDTVAAGAMMAARLASAAGRMIDFELANETQSGTGATLIVAPVRSLAPASLSGLGLDPDQVRRIWEARAETSRASGQSGSVPAPTLDRMRRNVPPRCSLPDLTLRVAGPVPPRAASSSSPADGRPAVTRATFDGDLATKWDETLRTRHPLVEAAGDMVERASSTFRDLLGESRGWLDSGEPVKSLNVPPSASLVLAQGFLSTQGANDSFDDTTTLVTAPNAILLKASVACLIDPEVWSKVGGRFAFLNAADGRLDTIEPDSVRLIATQDRSVSNLRLVAAGWLSMNPIFYVALALGLALCLGLSTTVMVRNVGRRNR